MGVYELRFHNETRHWRVYDEGKLMYPMHCGDLLFFEIDGTYLPTKLELDTEWYVRFGEIKFWLHRKTKYGVLLGKTCSSEQVFPCDRRIILAMNMAATNAKSHIKLAVPISPSINVADDTLL